MTRVSGGSARAWVALGANIGAPQRTCARALRWLDASPGVAVEAVSAWRWTEPVGGPPQPAYLNGVARLRTGLAPRPLLETLLRLEAAAGRRRSIRWGPRVLDLDLLLYEDRVLTTAPLTLPHPRLHLRPFVLEPLCDLDPDLVHPRLDQTMAQLLLTLS